MEIWTRLSKRLSRDDRQRRDIPAQVHPYMSTLGSQCLQFLHFFGAQKACKRHQGSGTLPPQAPGSPLMQNVTDWSFQHRPACGVDHRLGGHIGAVCQLDSSDAPVWPWVLPRLKSAQVFAIVAEASSPFALPLLPSPQIAPLSPLLLCAWPRVEFQWTWDPFRMRSPHLK